MPALGFSVVALVVFLLLLLLARRWWRRAGARRAEVMRLALLAAEEAAQAEEESSRVALGCRRLFPAAAGGVAGPRLGVCAVCHCPTTTRCSRCKAVKYCSGKCQILHWRQGHKNECGFPRIDDCFVAQVGITPLNGLTVEGSDLHNNHPNSEGNYQAAVMISSKKLSSTSSYSSEAFSDDEFLNSSGTESASDSSDSSSSSYSVFFGPVKPFDAFSSAVYPSVLHKSGSEIQSSSNISHDSTTYKERENSMLDARSHMRVSRKVPDVDICSQTKSRNEMLPLRSLSGVAQTYTTLRTSLNESCPPYGSKSHSGQASPAGQFISDYASRKVDNPSKPPAKFRHNAESHSSDIKTSVQKVVQQLKLSKLSQQHTSRFDNNSSKKPKMLFPFEYFVKLYNFDKVVLCPSGLINCHNSCYANAVLQSFAFTTPLAAYLLEGVHSKSCPKRGWCFTCELENLLINAQAGQSPLSPAGILSHMYKIGKLGLGREEDAHEFLRYAIDAMESVCLKEAGLHAIDRWTEETSFIQLTFGGYLHSKIECMKCNNRSEHNERMMDLTLDIEGNIGTLEEALRKFTMTEVLDGDNKYQCLRCKSYERAKKKLTIVDAPNILTIALKRFQSGKFGKLNKAVSFPEYLDLAPYMHGGSTGKSLGYKLYSVVVHLDVMNAAFSGHYVCYVKNIQGKWFKTDDAMVEAVEVEQVLSKNAYMLFYARCSPHCPSLTSRTSSLDRVLTKRSRSREAHSSGYDREKTMHDLPECHDEPNQMVGFSFSLLEPCNPINRMFHFSARDSSSDSSSLFSCSDETSCSAESTRNSTSTEDFSDYIFGNLDQQTWQSPSRFSNFLDGNGNSASYSTHSSAAVNCTIDSVTADTICDGNREQCRNDGASSFLYSDTTIRSKLTESSRETDGIVPAKLKPSFLRRSSTSRGRTSESYR
ncbi:ubiquitin carboxyl-terminal hydrolase 17-like isoform X2 [Curcuma longa]|uniref:ubiquitin carboxyl-terminal hydrolase 17-like isoform X2 n=1 Tax=Curcuma longa TaxID=136217 RepID=UPI003D9F0095